MIADDLTGVCDTGAQFASAGLRTIGSVTQEFKSKTVPRVLIVNTQSRSLEGREASLIIQQAACGLKRFEPKWFFKKIDTALRGNIAIEVFSMMEALGVDARSCMRLLFPEQAAQRSRVVNSFVEYPSKSRSMVRTG